MIFSKSVRHVILGDRFQTQSRESGTYMSMRALQSRMSSRAPSPPSFPYHQGIINENFSTPESNERNVDLGPINERNVENLVPIANGHEHNIDAQDVNIDNADEITPESLLIAKSNLRPIF